MPKILCLSLSLSVALAVGTLRADDPPAKAPAVAATPTPPPAPTPAVKPTPVGRWKWFVGPSLTFDAQGSVTGTRRPAVWFWLDEDKRELQVVWGGPEPGLDRMILSADGQRLEGSNNDGTPVSGGRIVEVPEPSTPSPTEPAATAPGAGVPGAAGAGATVPATTTTIPASNVTPVGTWSWFYGPDLTFHEDGAVTGENRTARWVWTDRPKRALRVDFGGDYAGFRDSLTLSEDGKQLRGVNNTGLEISGDRLASPSPTPAGTEAQKTGKSE